MNFKKYLKYILFSKYQFFTPKKKFVIFDNINLKYLLKYIDESKIEIIFIRGEKFNIPIFLKTLMTSGFSVKKYYENYINSIDPDFCITFSDNNKLFYELKLKKKIKKISIQNAWRNPQDDDLLKYKKKTDTNLYCDYFFAFNDLIGKKYLEVIDTKVVTVGSFKSNSVFKEKKNKKFDLLYISSFNHEKKIVSNTEMTVSTYHKNQPNLLKQIDSYAQNHEKNLFIYGKKENFIEMTYEKKYFKNYLSDKFKFIKNNRLKSIEIIDDSSIIITINSTLGYEALARGKKVIFFNVLPNSKTSNFTKFGWPLDLKDEGLFWTRRFDKKSVFEIIDRVKKLSTEDWIGETSHISRLLIEKDSNNSKFRQIIGH